VKLVAQIKTLDEETRIRKLTLEAEQAQGRLMIAQLAAKLRKNRAELRKLTMGGPNVEKPVKAP